MKTTLIFLILTLIITTHQVTYSQDVYRTKYRIPLVLQYNGKTVPLQKEEQKPYKLLTAPQKLEIDKLYPIGSTLSISTNETLNEVKTVVEKTVIIDTAFFNSQKFSFPTGAGLKNSFSGNVLFEEDKIYINPWKLQSKEIYYFKLDNRMSAKLRFTEITVTALTLPLKYRFKNENDGRAEEFATGLNASVFGGFSFGRSNFFYRKKVGNKVSTTKWTPGILLGSSTVTLNKSNTTLSEKPITDDSQILKGLASFALGITFTRDKLNVGGFYGWDYSVGDDAKRWNYNKKPWLGIALGYSLFTI